TFKALNRICAAGRSIGPNQAGISGKRPRVSDVPELTRRDSSLKFLTPPTRLAKACGANLHE
ncbi:MAG: hypothetical protein K6U80_18550, partial [Firmicutes bacterium]|nr:hypothetical protein [Bacillota bacterium]